MMMTVQYKDETYELDTERNIIKDTQGNSIKVNITGEVPLNNIGLYAHDLFSDLYDSLDSFNTFVNDKHLNTMTLTELE